MAAVSSCAFFAILLCASAKRKEACVTPDSSTPDQQHQPSEQMLLALRSSINTGTFSEEVTEHLAEYEAWSKQHQLTLQKVGRSKTLLDQMIADQSKASSPCTSMLLDVEHTVSSLMHDLRSLSDQVSTQVRTLEAETGKLNSTVLAFENVDKEFSEGVSECSVKRKQAAQNLSLYNAQLEVLKKIAKPSSPYTHTGKIEWPPVAPSLLEDGFWNKERCLAFVNFTQQHQEHFPQTTNTDCDANREELHKVCSAMYISIRGLAKEAEEHSEDKTCDRLIKKRKDEQLVSLVSQRKQQVSHIKFSSEKLEAIEPVLAHLNDQVNDLDAKVQDPIIKHPECGASDAVAQLVAVPDMLLSMHELIHSLQECPSHNYVVAKLPAEEVPQHVTYTVCAGDGDCGTEEPSHHNATSQMSNPTHVQAIMSWGGELE